MKTIVVLTGPPGCGKTMACVQLADLARQRALNCAGVISPARFEGGVKVGIDVLDVRTGQRRPLAEAGGAGGSPTELRTPRYRFDADAVAWGGEVLNAACPCDVLIVDELGPLELERGQGWANALDILRDGPFGMAVVVVRPGLLDVFRARLAGLMVSVVTLTAYRDQGYLYPTNRACRPE